MNARLMYPDRDFDPKEPLPAHAPLLVQDLELNTLLSVMAGDDRFLFDVAQSAVLTGCQNGVDVILYRQEIVQDCLKHPAVIRELYGLAVEAIEERRKHAIYVFNNYPAGTVSDAVGALRIFAGILRKLRGVADANPGGFDSRGFRGLFSMLQREFSDEYLAEIQGHLKELGFEDGVLVSVELGEGNEGANYVLRQTRGRRRNWLQRLFGKKFPGYAFRIHERDEAGARIISQMRDYGLNLVADALGQSAEHVLSFFTSLRAELAFYVGCMQLHDALATRKASVCFPQPHPAGTGAFHFTALRDVGLVLTMGQGVVGNDLKAEGKNMVIITGANQGGKSSLLRGAGVAQVMMQCGMFVAAEAFAAEVCPGLFTHYKREEDKAMKSGKLDEELCRMSEIVSVIAPNSMLLFNESFASTNEREGSEIARQIVSALVDRGVKVWFVTHQHDFARSVFDSRRADTLFLRAERRADGTRTFKIIEGEPLATSYGEDLYAKVFSSETLDKSGMPPPFSVVTGAASEGAPVGIPNASLSKDTASS